MESRIVDLEESGESKRKRLDPISNRPFHMLKWKPFGTMSSDAYNAETFIEKYNTKSNAELFFRNASFGNKNYRRGFIKNIMIGNFN